MPDMHNSSYQNARAQFVTVVAGAAATYWVAAYWVAAGAVTYWVVGAAAVTYWEFKTPTHIQGELWRFFSKNLEKRAGIPALWGGLN
jgi:hypothetical protein